MDPTRIPGTLQVMPDAPHRVRRSLLERVEHRLGRVFPGDRILDLACGDGFLALHLAERLPRCRVLALDASRGNLEVVRGHARDPRGGSTAGLDLLQAHPAHLPLREEVLQAVVTAAPLEDEPPSGIAEEAHRVLFWWGKLLAVALEDPTGERRGLDLLQDEGRELLATLGYGKVAEETMERYRGGRRLALLQAKKLEEPP